MELVFVKGGFPVAVLKREGNGRDLDKVKKNKLCDWLLENNRNTAFAKINRFHCKAKKYQIAHAHVIILSFPFPSPNEQVEIHH